MYRVSELLDYKRERNELGLHTVGDGTTALDAARLMNEQRIGSLLVIDQKGTLVGIFTERDMLTRVVAAEASPGGVAVSEVMTSPVLTCEPGTRLEELRQVMRDKRIRHVPVVDNGRLEGMVSIGDLNIAENETLVETIRSLEAYIAGA